jgi:hypothetical protein
MMPEQGKPLGATSDDSRPRCEGCPRGRELISELEGISTLIDSLESAYTSLPYVRADGTSDCHFAGQLFEQKEELEQKVQDKIVRLDIYHRQLASAARDCLATKSKIQADYGQLNQQEPQDWYAEAIRREEENCLAFQDDRDAVAVVLTRAKMVLAMSQKATFPVKKPPGRYPLPTGPAGTTGVGPSRPSSGSPDRPAGGEIAGLIALGPLGSVGHRSGV